MNAFLYENGPQGGEDAAVRRAMRVNLIGAMRLELEADLDDVEGGDDESWGVVSVGQPRGGGRTVPREETRHYARDEDMTLAGGERGVSGGSLRSPTRQHRTPAASEELY